MNSTIGVLKCASGGMNSEENRTRKRSEQQAWTRGIKTAKASRLVQIEVKSGVSLEDRFHLVDRPINLLLRDYERRCDSNHMFVRLFAEHAASF